MDGIASKARNILIVEDEEVIALDMRMSLESIGYRVVDIVDTGKAALERAAALKPDLVLMDIRIRGEQDGIDVAARLREHMDVPVIFVTAFSDEATLERAKRVSPYGYIVKPFHERELRIAIELALYKHQYELSILRARDLAEESNRIKGDFLANMSHELKTPLNSVIGFIELAMPASKENEQIEHLAIALSSAKSLLTLIDSILDFARMESGKLAAFAVPFSLDAVLGECADSLSMGAFAKGLEVYFGRDPALPDAVIGDSSLLKHILLNLLDNAVKFTEQGRIRLEVSAPERKSDADLRLTIAFDVIDTGIGMPKEKIGQAFTRFTQLDASKTRKAGGTGLGLAIVAKSVELMEGSFSVESEEGKGTRFSLRIPFEQGADERQMESPTTIFNGREVGLLGFDEEAYADASLVLARLGFPTRRTEGIRDAVRSGKGMIIADERSTTGMTPEDLSMLESRLIVGARFGGNFRSRLGKGRGIIFTTLPLRADSLRVAISALGSMSGKMSGQSEAPPGENGSGATEVRPAMPDKGILARLADALDKAVASGAFSMAEREAKAAQTALLKEGNGTGARLAFSALLLARKGDVAGLREAGSRMRTRVEEDV